MEEEKAEKPEVDEREVFEGRFKASKDVVSKSEENVTHSKYKILKVYNQHLTLV